MADVRVFIGLGSNLGDRYDYIRRALLKVDELEGVRVYRVSSLIETEPVGGPAGQGMFVNGVAELRCDLSAGELLAALLEIENELGRERQERWGARTIDLDLLLFGREVIDEAELVVPHPLMAERDFVMIPMAEIAGEVFHPVLGKTMREVRVAPNT